MDNLCNNCIHKDVCAKFRATGGVRECEHHKEERKGKWKKTEYFGYLCCSCCNDVYIPQEWKDDGKFAFCPGCGADLR